jgi:parvulin-like peptidyl-prolyl isomerase
MIDSSRVVTAGEVSLSLGDWLANLKRRGRLVPLLREGMRDRLVVQRALEAGLSVSDAELQAVADAFRRRHGLTSAAATTAWLARQGLTVEDFEEALEADLLAEKLQDHLTRDRIAAHFAAHAGRHARARLRRIVLAGEELARELLAQISSEGGDFVELARAHSLDHACRAAGGSLGLVPRWGLSAPAAEAIFAARPGDVIGPIASGQGFQLFLVEELLPGVLDEETTAVIRQELFDGWLAEQLRDVRIDLASLGLA